MQPIDEDQRDVGGAPEVDRTTAAGDPRSTRERILDTALDLFIEQGFDGTSLREIAERLRLTKAALYYHFSSKDDLLMALHLRVHAVGKEGLKRLIDGPATLEKWEALLDEVLGQMLAQRRLFLMHERNQAAIEKLHREDHEADHDDIQEKLRQVLTNPAIRLRDRIRMACSFGAVFAVLFMAGDAFEGTPEDELGQLLRDVIHDTLST
jgi:AcrR family transcriptional regulator